MLLRRRDTRGAWLARKGAPSPLMMEVVRISQYPARRSHKIWFTKQHPPPKNERSEVYIDPL